MYSFHSAGYDPARGHDFHAWMHANSRSVRVVSCMAEANNSRKRKTLEEDAIRQTSADTLGFSLLDRGVLLVDHAVLAQFMELLTQSMVWRLSQGPVFVDPIAGRGGGAQYNGAPWADLFLSDRASAEVNRVFVELDFKTDTPEQAAALVDLDGVGGEIVRAIHQYIVSNAQCSDQRSEVAASVVVSSRVPKTPEPVYGKTVGKAQFYKTGMHLHFPELFVSMVALRSIWRDLIRFLSESPQFGAERLAQLGVRVSGASTDVDRRTKVRNAGAMCWSSVIDLPTALRLNGCYKTGKCMRVVLPGDPAAKYHWDHGHNLPCTCTGDGKMARHDNFYWWDRWLHYPVQSELRLRVPTKELFPQDDAAVAGDAERREIRLHANPELVLRHRVYLMTTMRMNVPVPGDADTGVLRTVANVQWPRSITQSGRLAKGLAQDTQDVCASRLLATKRGAGMTYSNEDNLLVQDVKRVLSTVVERGQQPFNLASDLHHILAIASQKRAPMSVVMVKPPTVMLGSLFGTKKAPEAPPPSSSAATFATVPTISHIEIQALRQAAKPFLEVRDLVPLTLNTQSEVWRVYEASESMCFLSFHIALAKGEPAAHWCMNVNRQHRSNTGHFHLTLPYARNTSAPAVMDVYRAGVDTILRRVGHTELLTIFDPLTLWMVWFANMVLSDRMRCTDMRYWYMTRRCWDPECSTYKYCMLVEWSWMAPLVRDVTKMQLFQSSRDEAPANSLTVPVNETVLSMTLDSSSPALPSGFGGKDIDLVCRESVSIVFDQVANQFQIRLASGAVTTLVPGH